MSPFDLCNSWSHVIYVVSSTAEGSVCEGTWWSVDLTELGDFLGCINPSFNNAICVVLERVFLSCSVAGNGGRSVLATSTSGMFDRSLRWDGDSKGLERWKIY